MAWSSWVPRSVSRNSSKTKTPDPITQSNLTFEGKPDEEDDLGVTDQLIDYIKSFTLDTFKNFPLQDNEGATSTYDDGTARSSSANVRNDLSEWQERHAVLVLSKVKELSQLRFKLCPRYLKEQQFWRIYFKVVKNHVVE
ncbi:uncharacterized protein LOC110821753 [Carica papaya]|uniref:uncharacterized protein LOC110821753 n=1 Tax=Carica papaya TaxID=3649 RepID=UPI000B8CC399|nr:uncharacterized protein LOC110821753 [Carica papaya]